MEKTLRRLDAQRTMTDVETVQFAGSNGITLIADVAGPAAGIPVLLLHGTGQTRHSWRRALETLIARGYRACAVDLRGHGDSQRAIDGRYSAQDNSKDVRAIAAVLGSPPVIVGASLGGVAALLACGEQPQLEARALVVIDIAARWVAAGSRGIRSFMQGTLGGFDSLEEARLAIGKYLPHRQTPTDSSGLVKNLRRESDGRWYWHWDPALIANPLPQGSRLEAYEKMIQQAAMRVRAPTLIVRGGRSEVVTSVAARELQELISGAQLIEIEQARHMVAGDSNDTFLSVLLDFILQTAPRPS
jgi:non-heme chloroperoxidase